MLEIRTDGFDEVRDFLAKTGVQMPFATAYLLTQLGMAARDKVKGTIPQVFDRPNPWTQNSIYLQPATKSRQFSKVWIKDNSLTSLAHHVEGGQRKPKLFERRLRIAGILKGSHQYVVPSLTLKLDQYGNVSRGLINKVLSSLGAQSDVYANTTAKALTRNKTQGDYFVVPRSEGTPAGIYQRKGVGANTNLVPVFIFVKSTKYKRRFPFYEKAEDGAYDAIPKSIDKTIQQLGW